MRLRESVVKELLAAAGIAVPAGRVCDTVDEVRDAAAEFGEVAVKSLVREWGRGKAGLVRRCADPDAAVAAFADLTARAPDDPCLVERWQSGVRELYLAELIDPELGGKAILFAPAGGVDLETARGVRRIPVPVATGATSFHARQVLATWRLPAGLRDDTTAVLRALDTVFTDNDGRLLEINPLGWSAETGFVALDAKLVVDDNALPRHPEFVALHRADRHADVSDELRITHRLEYVELDGDVGLISGGAGMTMAAMDVIAERGGAARGFLDCSQNPTADGYRAALSALHEDPRTSSVLVNIVGGGTEVDGVATVLAQLLDEYRAGPAAKPVVVRLEGTNAQRAHEILDEHGIAWQGELEDAVDAVIGAPRRAS